MPREAAHLLMTADSHREVDGIVVSVSEALGTARRWEEGGDLLAASVVVLDDRADLLSCGGDHPVLYLLTKAALRGNPPPLSPAPDRTH